jgi:hypothetical protein
MRWGRLQTRSPWWALAAAGVVLAAALAGRAQVGAWPFGVLLLLAWGLLAYGLRVLRIARPLRLLLTVSLLALAVVVWNETAPQPRIQLGGVRVQKLPSTISPGVVELVFRNSGSLPADVVGSAVAHLSPLFRTPRDLAAGGVEADLSARLERAGRWPSAGTTLIPPGQTTRVEVDIPPSQRSWYIGRGQATVIVTARLRYRDRAFLREKTFCLFTNARSGQWLSCPFLND